ncbi:hypothetical protein BN14_00071 [Rhizoctonia solani AG-1 IB]|uniref:Uncharacterized protein n=1 Tax=Thanatephorus cucumeris (strain AG1-IB / isolate 7/3/14) TaxID=1108050 RepID=M5BJ85_THACB|nr:hypothetical protein BN14_00071 [Rhizoctonia solani AG-1 IB]
MHPSEALPPPLQKELDPASQRKKDDGESEPEGRAVRRTAGTPSGSEDESEEEVKSPKSPKPPRSPTTAKSPRSPKQPAAKSQKPPPPAKSSEAKPAENKPAEIKQGEEGSEEAKPADEAKLEGAGAEDEKPDDGEPDGDKKGKKGHGFGYVNKDRHKTGGERGKMTTEELTQKMEQMRIQNEEIKRKRLVRS